MTSSDSSCDFIHKSLDIDRLIAEAKLQFEINDHTRLVQPVHYRILWLGYTHVTYEELDFQMTEFDHQYLQSVILNFKSVVELYSNHNIEIENDLFFINKPTKLSKQKGENWLYLSFDAVQDEVNKYNIDNKYDTILSVVQTKGKENDKRNQNKPGFGINDVILGLKLQGIENHIGYSTFNLFEPKKGTFPLRDPTVPSLYATAVAVHEWLHQLEYLQKILQIEFPPTHAYQGEPKYPGYSKVESDANNYDYWEFYQSVLSGKCHFTPPDSGMVKEVGIYPKMWRLIPRNALNVGTYTIQSAFDNNYLIGQEKIPKVTKSNNFFNWDFRYEGNFLFTIVPSNMKHLRIDLDNGWDIDGTKVKLYVKTIEQYTNAQRWLFTKNDDGTFCIRTAYKSHRAISVDEKNAQAVIRYEKTPSDSQKWIVSNSNSNLNKITQNQALNIINQNLSESVKKDKVDGVDAFVVDLNFGCNLNAASFAVSEDGQNIYLKNQKTGKFEKKII